MGIDLRLQILDFGLVGQLFAVIRLLQGVLQFRSQLNEGTVQKVHILAAVGIRQRKAGVFQLLQLLHDSAEGAGNEPPHQKYKASCGKERNGCLHNNPDGKRLCDLPGCAAACVAGNPQIPLPHRLQGTQTRGGINRGRNHAAFPFRCGCLNIRQDGGRRKIAVPTDG